MRTTQYKYCLISDTDHLIYSLNGLRPKPDDTSLHPPRKHLDFPKPTAPSKVELIDLPTEILTQILEQLTESQLLCLALTSRRHWQYYLSTSPSIPRLWTETSWSSIVPWGNERVPLGVMLTDWMGSAYHEIRPDPAWNQDKVIKWIPYDTARLPPFFIRSTSRLGEEHDGDVFMRYKLYHASVTMRKPHILPHPRNRRVEWWEAAKLAIMEDGKHFRGIEDWKRYWQIFRWNGLQGADRNVAKELVEKAYEEMDLRGWEWEVDEADCDLILFQ